MRGIRRGRLAALVTVLALALAAPLALAGCGGGEELTSDEITLEVWDAWYKLGVPGFDAAMSELDKRFMAEHPNITIKHRGFPMGTYETKVWASIAAKKGPDVIGNMWPTTTAAFLHGLLQLDDMLTDEQKENILLLSPNRNEGKQYIIPVGVFIQTWTYNKELFEKGGLDPEAPPETWEEFLDACETLHAAGIIPTASVFKEGYLAETMHMPLAGQLVTPEELDQWWQFELPWTHEGIQKGFEYLIEMRDHNCFPEKSYALTGTEMEAMWLGGKAAMIWRGPPLAKEKQTAATAGQVAQFPQGVFRMPLLPDSVYGEPYLDIGSAFGMSISAYTEHPEEAFAYVSFYVSQEGQQIWWDKALMPPTRRDVELSSTDPITMQILEWLKEEQNHSSPWGRYEEETVLWQRGSQLIKGDVTPAELAEELQKIREDLNAK